MLVLLALGWASVTGAAAADLTRFHPELEVGKLVPGADRLGEVTGSPPAAPAYAGDVLKGYVFLNADVVNAVGYSGKPIRIAIGIDTAGVITGLELVEHHEPIVLIGIPEERVDALIQSYVGRSVESFLSGAPGSGGEVDIISGATVTVLVIDDSIRRSAIQVARSRSLAGLAPERAGQAAGAMVVDPTAGEIQSWSALAGDGSLRRLDLTVGDVTRAFREAGQAEAAGRPEARDPDTTFIELYSALVSVPAIGRSLLGERDYANLERRLEPGQHAILVAASGRYSFKGSGYVRGGIFDRIALIQRDQTIRFRDRQHLRAGRIAADGAPRLNEVDLFIVPEEAQFDPTRPWELQLLVQRSVGGRDKAFVTFELGYSLPQKYLKPVQPAAPAAGAASGTDVPRVGEVGLAVSDERADLWQRIWHQKAVNIALLVVALGVLTGLFFFQDWFVRRPRLTTWVRYGFLTLVLVWLGFYANAQLSVVNVLTFTNALLTDFSWTYFLMDPLVFILWFAVAAGLLFWGRGAFCGWLCPFGALQELTNHIGRRLGIPQVSLPWGLNERLWPVKYIIFLGLFGLSLYSLSWAERLAEVEPFKTAIILDFVRSWPFVAYAGGLLVVGLFIERFFCRYLCPLGAALAIPGRLRMFEWLKRHPECGSPCQRCAKECPVAAIHPDGRINVHECIYCLDCQKLYYDDHKCPHMIQLRLKRERRRALSSESMLSEKQRAAHAEKAQALSD
jgi:NosR/NirI family nitrous oxide reductase transcriptional regulator